MAVPTVRRAFSSISKQRSFYTARDKLHFGLFLQLLRITVALVLLPFNNAILLAAYIAGYFSSLSRSAPIQRRQAALRDVQFYPKTVLVTGVDTPYGLSVARSWYYQGHRVVGANLTDSSIPSGESMSKCLVTFYRVPKSNYVSRLLDIIHREKIDVWVPCSHSATVFEDAVAKQVIEGRTDCKCITLDTELATVFSREETFRQYLVEKGLPVVENHHVQSRDSIHKILHRSPTKTYRMYRPNSIMGDDKTVILPKRTISLTYSEVSEIQISKESPWILQQESRVGEILAELLVVRGHVRSIKVHPADSVPNWGQSRLDEGLAVAIHRLMERFALKGGHRMTGHLCVRLMVDEEVDTNHVRYALSIAGCTQGAIAVASLLQDASDSLIRGYLTVESPHLNGIVSTDSVDTLRIQEAKSIISTTPRPNFSLYQSVREWDVRSVLLAFYPILQEFDRLLSEMEDVLGFWKGWRFSIHDPLPWWCDAHVYRPLKVLESIFSSDTKRT
ncbi:hypothetical protein EYZ11_005749 [Aspergillus tanneri]|uniref:ATP-grasp domain-containing protein n=1 Tax=Aspergillus tanneri TaxID=1220188 RepID=A0A4S3JJH6_9EURO|nr:uncharacterized protein ATNIH1004_006390 [Aspergillus tanneri]KAA8647696.1 hypothetical protein ATNIH1004_006390 [Aspergillus tanneri]THC94757.1 hypothetical protein EYZ11_005749 [Aspergillus tanneri]